MKFMAYAFKLELLNLLKSGKIVLFALIPLCAALLTLLLPPQELLPLTPVGWAVPEGCERAGELLGLLRESEGYVEFIETDEETLYRNVVSGKYECGFVLRDDFDARIDKGYYSRLFTLVKSESSTMHSLVSEAVSSAMLTMVAEDIGREYLLEIGASAPEDGWILEDSLRLEIVPAAGGEIGSAFVSEKLGQNVLKGAVAILLTLLSISLGDGLARRRKQEYHERMAALVGQVKLVLPPILAQSLMMLLVSMLSLLASGVYGFAELTTLCLCLAAQTFFISALPGGHSATLLPFLPVAMLVLCPILFDVSAFLPGLRYLSMLIPATHYLNGAKLPLVILGAIYALLGAAAYKKYNKFC